MENNNWNDKIENKLLDNIKSCILFENAHNNERKHNKKMLKTGIFLGIFIMALNTLLSSLTLYEKTNNVWLNIAIGILSAISVAAGTIMSFYDPAKKISTHTEIRDKYRHIMYKINWELFLDTVNRKDGNEFLAKICQEMMELEIGEDTTPVINTNELVKNRIILKRSGTMKKCDTQNNTSNDNDIALDIENDELINGLSEDENINFSLLFKKIPIDDSLLNYQMQRFNM